MPAVGKVLLVSRVLSYVLDKYFDARGANMREKVKSAEPELGPELTRDLTKIANTEAAVKGAPTTDTVDSNDEFDAAVDRAWHGLRKRKPEATIEELKPTPPPKVEESSGSGWLIAAVLMLLFALAVHSARQ